MVDVLNLYIDDSGSRKPSRKLDGQAGRNWFGLGGFLIRDRDEDVERTRYGEFVARWPELTDVPLHSVDIRGRAKKFSWLRKDEQRANAFYDELTCFILGADIRCMAVVIDRSGYRVRYEARYKPEERWLLCKTAFCILLERCAKQAAEEKRKLRVLVERGDPETDRRMETYYDELRVDGMPFAADTMKHYQPLDSTVFAKTLYEFRIKNKSSPMMQLADLVLYPICRHPYDPTYRPYGDLRKHGKLIDHCISANVAPTRGIKYSCFDPPAFATPPAV